MERKQSANAEASVNHRTLFIYKVNKGFMIPILDSTNTAYNFKVFTTLDELYNFLEVYFTLQA